MLRRRSTGRLLVAPVLLLACAVLAAGVLARVALVRADSSVAGPCPDAKLMPSHANLVKVRAATLCLINAERTRRGLRPLVPMRQLRATAQGYSRLMVRERFFSHVSPSGSTLTSRLRDQTSYLRGARRASLGETIAWGSGSVATPASTLAAWMGSRAHRANILEPGFRSIGIGVVDGAPRPTDGLPAATYTADFGHRS